MKLLRSKKGFTLMEIIVVLIIIAIMAAALIPSFVNFARNARANEFIAQARIAMSAAQAYITNEGAKGVAASTGNNTTGAFDALNWGLTNRSGAAWEAFQQNLTGDIADPRGFFNVRQEGVTPPATNATIYRVSGISYVIADNLRGGGWAVQIDDVAGRTEYWRPGATAGSEGTPAASKPNRPPG